MAVYKRGKIWWYKFNWNGQPIRESTKHTNKRVAEQMEAAHKTSLAKGEVGIRDRAPVPILTEFADADFLPFIEARFENKPNTLDYYKNGLKSLKVHAPLAGCTLDTITADRIGAFVAKLRQDSLSVASINRQLEVLRRLLKLAVEWGKVRRCSREWRCSPVRITGTGFCRKKRKPATWKGQLQSATELRKPINAR
jgi:hypothetical protein